MQIFVAFFTKFAALFPIRYFAAGGEQGLVVS